MKESVWSGWFLIPFIWKFYLLSSLQVCNVCKYFPSMLWVFLYNIYLVMQLIYLKIIINIHFLQTKPILLKKCTHIFPQTTFQNHSLSIFVTTISPSLTQDRCHLKFKNLSARSEQESLMKNLTLFSHQICIYT